MRLLKAFLNWCVAHPRYSAIVTRNAAKSTKAREILGKPKLKRDLLQREQLAAWFGEVRKIGKGDSETLSFFFTLDLAAPSGLMLGNRSDGADAEVSLNFQ